MATQVCVECKAVYTVAKASAPGRCAKCASKVIESKSKVPTVRVAVKQKGSSETADENATAEILLDTAPTCEADPGESIDEAPETPSGDISDYPTMELSQGQTLPRKPGQPTQPEASAPPAKKRTRNTIRGLKAGAQLGPYRILSEIGRGGMGVVLKGRDDALKRDIAVKTLLPDARRNPTHELRFIQEAQIAGQLEHPGIAPVHLMSWDEEGNGFFSMKLVSGKSLENILDKWHKGDAAVRADFPLQRLMSIFERVCEAIGYAHSHRVIHRDLKPANVMIGDYGEVLVLDWGLAKVLGSDDIGQDALSRSAKSAAPSNERPSKTINKDLEEANVTLDGTVVGTPGYMAPEQSVGDAIDEGVDIFGLGGLLYEILTGSAPFTGKNVNEIIANSARGRVKPIPKSVHGRTIPRGLAAIAGKCLERRRKDRYATTAELLRDIRAWSAGEMVSALPDSSADRLKRFAQRHRRILTWVGAVGALVGSVLIYAAFAVWRQDVIAREEHEKRLNAEVEKERAEAATAEQERQARQAQAERELARTEQLKAELEKHKAIANEAERASRRLKAFEPYSQAMDLLMRGQLPDRAADLLKKALAIDPEFVEAQFALGQALQSAGVPAAAAAAYLKADQLNQSITGKPNLQALIAAGFTFDGAGCYAEAEDAFSRADRCGANDPLAQVGRVFQAGHSRRIKPAIATAELALKAAPHLWETHFALAFAQYEGIQDGVVPRSTLTAVLDGLQKALELAPRQAEVCYWYALALAQAGKAEEAIAYVNKSVALEPRNGNRYVQRCTTLDNRSAEETARDIAEGKRLGASETLLQMCEVHKAVTENNMEKACQLMGKLVRQSREWPSLVGQWMIFATNANKLNEVMPVFQRWRQQNPEYYLTHEIAAYLLVNADPPAAMRELDDGLKFAPFSVDLHRMKATIQLRQGEFGLALEAAEKALECQPHDFASSSFKAQALAGLHRMPEALALIKQLRIDFPAQAANLDAIEQGIKKAQ